MLSCNRFVAITLGEILLLTEIAVYLSIYVYRWIMLYVQRYVYACLHSRRTCAHCQTCMASVEITKHGSSKHGPQQLTSVSLTNEFESAGQEEVCTQSHLRNHYSTYCFQMCYITYMQCTWTRWNTCHADEDPRKSGCKCVDAEPHGTSVPWLWNISPHFSWTKFYD